MRRGLAVLALLAAACSGGGGDEDADASGSSSGSASSADEESTTTTEEEVGVELPSAFRAEGSVDLSGSSSEVTSVVADPSHYELVLVSEVSQFHVVRDGDAVFLRSAPDAAAAEGRRFQVGTSDDSTAIATLLGSASFGPIEEGFALSGAETASDAIAELVFTDPAALLDVDDVTADGVFDVDLPDDIADALDDLGTDEPTLEARIDVDDDGVVGLIELRLSSDEVDVDIRARFDDVDEVTDDDLEVPTGAQIDVTPFVDEEELLTYTETPLLVPPAAPPGTALVTAVVLDVFESREGCQQVQIDFAPPDDPDSTDFVEYFLIDKTCMNGFDPTPFDEITNGLPSRFDGAEILVGDTVVQILPGDPRFDVGAFVASLVPVTADQLVAAVVPPAD